MKNKENNAKINKNNIKKPKAKRKKLSQQRLIQIFAISMAVIFVGGTLSGTILYLFNNKTPGSNIVQYDTAEAYLKQLSEYEAKLKKDPENYEYVLGYIQANEQLGYIAKSENNIEKATVYFLVAAEYAQKLKEINPSMATSAEYIIAGNLSEGGKLDEAEAIFMEIISSNVDPLNSRLYYAEFLINKRNDQAKADEQIEAARNAATSDAEKEYVNNLVSQYNLQ